MQHLGGRRLLLQRLGELAGARLHLVEQPHILDGDHRLVGERGDQFDLLVGERSYLRTRQHDHANRCAVAHERDAKNSSEPANSRAFDQNVVWFGLDISHFEPPDLRARLARGLIHR